MTTVKKLKKVIKNGETYELGGGIESSNNTYENIIHLSQADYDALQNKDPNTMYSTPDDDSGGGGSGGGGFKEISNCVYKNGLLVSFTADGENYTLTYQAGKLKTINHGDKTITVSYKGGRFISSSES